MDSLLLSVFSGWDGAVNRWVIHASQWAKNDNFQAMNALIPAIVHLHRSPIVSKLVSWCATGSSPKSEVMTHNHVFIVAPAGKIQFTCASRFYSMFIISPPEEKVRKSTGPFVSKCKVGWRGNKQSNWSRWKEKRAFHGSHYYPSYFHPLPISLSPITCVFPFGFYVLLPGE